MLIFTRVVKYLNIMNEFMRNTIDFIPFYWRELDSNSNNGINVITLNILEYKYRMIWWQHFIQLRNNRSRSTRAGLNAGCTVDTFIKFCNVLEFLWKHIYLLGFIHFYELYENLNLSKVCSLTWLVNHHRPCLITRSWEGHLWLVSFSHNNVNFIYDAHSSG